MAIFELVPLEGMGSSQGCALALRERVVVVRLIIGILFMVLFAKARITSFSTVEGCLNLYLSRWGGWGLAKA